MKRKKLFIVLLAIMTIAGVSFYLSPSSLFQGRMTGSSIGSGTSVPTKGGTFTTYSTASVDYDAMIADAEALAEEFNSYREDYYYELTNVIRSADTYDEAEEAEAFRQDCVDELNDIDASFNDFFDTYNDLEDVSDELNSTVSEDTAYTDSYGNNYSLESIYDSLIEDDYDQLERAADAIPAYGDLQPTDVWVTVDGNGNLLFTISIRNNENDSASSTRSMPAGDMYIEGRYQVVGAGSSYFGIDASDDTFIEAGEEGTVLVTMPFEERTPDLYDTYLERGGLKVDVDVYVNFNGQYEEYNADNNSHSQTVNAL